jgi:predicted RNA-binding protein YlqC (UPF0109 family)
MDDLLTYIVRHIVTHPDEVAVSQVISEDEQHLTLRLAVNQQDMGLVIGKDGNTARALRNILKVAALKSNQRVYLDILEAGADAPTQDEVVAE